MKYLSSVLVPYITNDIAVIDDKTAIVATENKILVILDISGEQMLIRQRVKLHVHYSVRGISSYREWDKLVVSCPFT